MHSGDMMFAYFKLVLTAFLLFCPLYAFANCKCEQITTYENGLPICHCKPGYVVNSINPKKCQDINECANTVEPACEQNCINTPGGFSCSCSDGYVISTTDSTKCVDINECANTVEPACEQNCINTPGGFSCSCSDGYVISTTDSTKCVGTCKTVNSSDPRPVVALTSEFQVMCDTVTDGGGWTIFQRRVSGTVDFYRNWTEYKNGFGDFSSGNFYLGNENIYLLTSNRQTELRVDMIFSGTKYFAKYSSFSISSETDGYRLQIGGFTGNVNDNLNVHNGMKFTTFDRDNDQDSYENCAQFRHGAWWYLHCYAAHLNGVWGTSDLTGINWIPMRGASFCEMKFRYN